MAPADPIAQAKGWFSTNYISWPYVSENVVEGNLETGNKTTVRTGLPTPTWRKLYGGIQPAKSTTAQVQDSCGMLEAYAEIDKALADLDTAAAIDASVLADTGLQASLTPSRANGFLNILRMMQAQASALAAAA